MTLPHVKHRTGIIYVGVIKCLPPWKGDIVIPFFVSSDGLCMREGGQVQTRPQCRVDREPTVPSPLATDADHRLV